MRYSVEYFHRRVKEEIEGWPVGILADYARLIELLAEFGPDLRMPHSRAMGGGLFELRPRGREGIGRALYCYVCSRRVVVLRVREEVAGNPGTPLEYRSQENEGGARWLILSTAP